MTNQEKNEIALKIIAMPPREWAAWRKKISAAVNIAARIRAGERSWKELMNGSVDRDWTKKILFAAGFRFFEDGVRISSLEEFGNKTRTVFPPEERSYEIPAHKIEFNSILWAEVQVDIYGGPNCDQHSKCWNVQAVGDMGEENLTEPDLGISFENYAPGTRVMVEEPLCPKCSECYDNCMVRGQPGDCDFDWENWVEEQYS